MCLRLISSLIKQSRSFSFLPCRSYSTRFANMKDGFVTVNRVPTRVLTWNQWIKDEFDSKFKSLVLVISGNPGLPGFYTTFGQTLSDEFEGRFPVWVIGHAGDCQRLVLNVSIQEKKSFCRSRRAG